MTWIKTEDLTPPTHEIILFQDRWKNEHYGVLCGDNVSEEIRNKFWCHVFKKTYKPKDIIYWTEIPINQHRLMQNSNFSGQVNQFLWDTVQKIEESILSDFKKQKQENPEWDAEQFVGIAVRNASWRIMNILKVLKDDK